MSVWALPRRRAGYRVLVAAAAVAAGFLAARAALAQPGAGAGPETKPARVLTYQRPDKAMVDLATAPGTPEGSIGPRGRWLLIQEPSDPPTIRDMVRPEVLLAGYRIDPRTNGPSRAGSGARSLTFQSLADSTRRPVSLLPSGAAVGNIQWSPDGLYVAFTVNDGNTIELWVTETEGEVTKRVLRQPLNALNVPFRWTPDSKALVCTIIPEDRPAAPEASPVPTGPLVRERAGTAAPYRGDLLRTPHDEVLFEHYLTSQLMWAEVNGKRKRLGDPGVITDFSVSPDGRFLLVDQIHRPFSFYVPAAGFPRWTEIWDMEGNRIRRLGDAPPAADSSGSGGASDSGPRAVQWRADTPATVAWVGAAPGDGGESAPSKDAVFALDAPFTGEPRVLAAAARRITAIQWGSDGLALLQTADPGAGESGTWWFQPGTPGTEPRKVPAAAKALGESSVRFLTAPNAQGRPVLLAGPGGTIVYRTGSEITEAGDHPVLDAVDLAAGTSHRLWQSEPPTYETPVRLLDAAGTRLVTRRETSQEPPNYVLRSLDSGGMTPLTAFKNPHADLPDFHRELVHFTGADGTTRSGLLYLPKPDSTAAPLLVWLRSHDAGAAGSPVSPYRFDAPGAESPLVWLTQGYAVLDDPALSTAGTKGAPEDRLVADALAAVKAVTGRSEVDSGRVAVGGDGSGAFTAAVLLSHCDRFRAGVLWSGRYNLTLTPFGFPGEAATLWQAPGAYAGLSPFLHADAVGAPVLIVHGEADAAGARDAEMFFDALSGGKAAARLVLLPGESAPYRARESVLHALWETRDWLGKALAIGGWKSP